ncbi:MAG: helix-turn-helix transcriptional regulator [Streptosporangiaceae bacterium]|nr:helix-turn-helix transcriptional regulator [Streptosporangiaceae bacterium]
MVQRDTDAMFLGTVLRRAREARGISQEGLADRFGYDRTVISKAESGLRPPSPGVARAYATAYPELNGLVEGGLIEQWSEHVRKHGGAVPRFFTGWLDAEGGASALVYWAPILVPGLFQTQAYARTILAVDPDSKEPLDERVAARLERQRILERAEPPMVTVVLAEAVLHRNVGGPAVMHEQLSHLAEIGQRPRVTIQVIPAEIGAHAGLCGDAAIADGQGDPTVVHLSTLTEGETTAEPGTVARVRMITDALRSEALPRGASRELILKVAQQRWTP